MLYAFSCIILLLALPQSRVKCWNLYKFLYFHPTKVDFFCIPPKPTTPKKALTMSTTTTTILYVVWAKAVYIIICVYVCIQYMAQVHAYYLVPLLSFHFISSFLFYHETALRCWTSCFLSSFSFSIYSLDTMTFAVCRPIQFFSPPGPPYVVVCFKSENQNTFSFSPYSFVAIK